MSSTSSNVQVGPNSEHGVALIVTVIIIAIVSVAMLTITKFLSARLEVGALSLSQLKAVNLAQSGIFKVLYDFRTNGTWGKGRDVALPAGSNQQYSVGEDANFLLVDTRNVTAPGIERLVKDVGLENVSSDSAITITHMTVNWAPDNGERVVMVRSQASVIWNGNAPSGEELDIMDITMSVGGSDAIGLIQFNSSMTDKTISCTFRFAGGDDSTRTVQVYPPAGRRFSIRSTGKVALGTDNWKRTLVATYDTSDAQIKSWNETLNHL